MSKKIKYDPLESFRNGCKRDLHMVLDLIADEKKNPGSVDLEKHFQVTWNCYFPQPMQLLLHFFPIKAMYWPSLQKSHSRIFWLQVDILLSKLHVLDTLNRDGSFYKLGIFAQRAATLCIALQDADLPALITLEIIDAIFENSERMWAKWQLITLIKHWHEKK